MISSFASKRVCSGLLGLGLALAGSSLAAAGDAAADTASGIERGRYLVVIGGCNDCHTANWNESRGAVPESDWLTGVPVGFRGPWGTTYASNLRLLAAQLDEDSWTAMLHERKDRPPMPWISTNNMHDADVRAMYQFIRSLGESGQRMPTAIGPETEPATPYILFEPLHMERLQPPRSTD